MTTALDPTAMTVRRKLGAAVGPVVGSMGLAKGLGAARTSLRQGEAPRYAEPLAGSRRHAIDKTIENARLPGASRAGLVRRE